MFFIGDQRTIRASCIILSGAFARLTTPVTYRTSHHGAEPSARKPDLLAAAAGAGLAQLHAATIAVAGRLVVWGPLARRSSAGRRCRVARGPLDVPSRAARQRHASASRCCSSGAAAQAHGAAPMEELCALAARQRHASASRCCSSGAAAQAHQPALMEELGAIERR